MAEYHRITVNLTKQEGQALDKLATKNQRKPASEARIAIKKHIKK